MKRYPEENKILLKLSMSTDTPAEEKLHPNYRMKFYSIFGPILSVSNLINVLGRPLHLYKYLRVEQTPNILKEIHKYKIRKVPHYWEIVSLVNLDKILSSKQLVADIINLDIGENEIIKVLIFNKIRQGVIEIEERTKKLRNLEYIIGDQIELILKEFVDDRNLDSEDVLKLPVDKYKEIKNSIKNNYIKEVLEKIDNRPLLEGVLDTTNEEIIEKYLR